MASSNLQVTREKLSTGTAEPQISGFFSKLLEDVPKKLLDFFDSDMLQIFEFERFLFDHVIRGDRQAR